MRMKVLGSPANPRGKRVEIRFSREGREYSFGWGLEEFKDILLSMRGGGADNIGRKGVVQFDKMVGEWEKLHGKSLRTWEDVERYRCLQLVERFGTTPIHRISPFDVEKYKASLLADGSSNVRTNRLLSLLKRVLGKAVKWGYLKSNPAAGIQLLPEQGRERALTGDEYTRLLKACDDWLRPVVILAANTGLRRGEILGLTWDRVDLAGGRIMVTRTKTDRSRSVPLNKAVLAALEKLPRHIGSANVFHQEGVKVETFRKRWKRAVDAAGLKDVKFHDLRHTFSTWLSERGFNPMVIMALTGHTSSAMLRRYTNISDPTMVRAVEALLAPAQVQRKTGTHTGRNANPSKEA